MKTAKDYLDTVARFFAEEEFMAEPAGLYAPIDYTLRLGGKRVRPTMLLMGNALFGGKDEDVRSAAIGIETFHNSTLLHDDLMDRSPLRRGQPTVYKKWDENTAVLSGDVMYALAWRYFMRQPSPRIIEVLKCFNDTFIEVCEGQQKDMDFETMALEEVSIDAYMDMIRQKTAVLLAASLKIGALYAGAPEQDVENIWNFGIHLGLAFQLQDDLLDGYGDTAVFGKKTGQDIRDNKKTFLPLKALRLCQTESDRDQIASLFAAKDNMDEEEKVSKAMALYDKVGLRPELEKEIKKEFELAQQCLESIQASDEAKQPLRQMVEMLFDRKK